MALFCVVTPACPGTEDTCSMAGSWSSALQWHPCQGKSPKAGQHSIRLLVLKSPNLADRIVRERFYWNGLVILNCCRWRYAGYVDRYSAHFYWKSCLVKGEQTTLYAQSLSSSFSILPRVHPCDTWRSTTPQRCGILKFNIRLGARKYHLWLSHPCGTTCNHGLILFVADALLLKENRVNTY